MSDDPARPKTARAATRRSPSARRAPQRTCVGCRTVQPKRQLVRLVRQADGAVAVDPTGKAHGRGAYLHDRRSCWLRALAGSALQNALQVTLTEANLSELRARANEYSDDDN
ncbi:MAG: YlxR family protein [Anaerolineales bacterium]|nr:YlxR family protein [Anaerolineales bacterium]